MTLEQASAVSALRDSLEEKLASIRDVVGEIKSDEIVDDEACDSVIEMTQALATEFNNRVAAIFGVEPLTVPTALEVSPYQ